VIDNEQHASRYGTGIRKNLTAWEIDPRDDLPRAEAQAVAMCNYLNVAQKSP